MADFNSKYTGEQVEEFLDQIANGEAGGGGGIAVETDPIFSASPAASITTEKISAWDDKEDKPIVFDADKAGIEAGDGSEEAPGTFTPEQFQLATGMTFTEFKTAVSNGKKVVLMKDSQLIELEHISVDEEVVYIAFSMSSAMVSLILACSDNNMQLYIAYLSSLFLEDYYTKEEIDTNKQDKISGSSTEKQR